MTYQPFVRQLKRLLLALPLSSAVLTFFMNSAAAQADPDTLFSIVVIPDTQYYIEKYPEIFENQISWIDQNKGPDQENIIYVAHLGDLKDSRTCDNGVVILSDVPGTNLTEWQHVNRALNQLDATGVPYSVVAGNHDFDAVGGGCNSMELTQAQSLALLDGSNANSDDDDGYNDVAGPQRFAGKSFYGDPVGVAPAPNDGIPERGNLIENSNQDNFVLFESPDGQQKFIAINFAHRAWGHSLDEANSCFNYVNNAEVDPVISSRKSDFRGANDGSGNFVPYYDSEVCWADYLLETYNDRLGILTTHYFLEENPQRNNGATNPSQGQRDVFGPYGEQIYAALNRHPNLFLMMSAHERGEAWRQNDRVDDTGTPDVEFPEGFMPVHALLADYQSVEHPGSAALTEATSRSLREVNDGKGDSGFMRIIRFASDGNAYVETFAPAMDAISEAPRINRNARAAMPKLTSAYTYDPDDSNDFLDNLTVSNFSFPYAGYLDGSGPGTPPPEPEPSTECPEFNKSIINQARIYPFNIVGGQTNFHCPAEGQTSLTYTYQRIMAQSFFVEYSSQGNLTVAFQSPESLLIRENRGTVYRINLLFFWVTIYDASIPIIHPSLAVTEAQAASCVAYYSQLVAGCP